MNDDKELLTRQQIHDSWRATLVEIAWIVSIFYCVTTVWVGK